MKCVSGLSLEAYERWALSKVVITHLVYKFCFEGEPTVDSNNTEMEWLDYWNLIFVCLGWSHANNSITAFVDLCHMPLILDGAADAISEEE